MQYDQMIKRAWQITWRHKRLWVLGLFAGATGCQASIPSGDSRSGTDSGALQLYMNELERNFDRFVERALGWLAANWPIVVAGLLALVVIWILIALVSAAASGALVLGADDALVGAPVRLRTLWARGFSRIWRVLGLDALFAVPALLALGVVILAASILLVGLWDDSPMLDSVGGIGVWGAVVGVALCLVLVVALAQVLLGPIALRYIMLGDRRIFAALADAWRFVRSRTGPTLAMIGLTMLLGLGVEIVVVVALVIMCLPLIVWAVLSADRIPQVLSAVLLGGAVIIVGALFFQAAWNTFTSALWTVFFREVTNPAPVLPPPPPPSRPLADV